MQCLEQLTFRETVEPFWDNGFGPEHSAETMIESQTKEAEEAMRTARMMAMSAAAGERIWGPGFQS